MSAAPKGYAWTILEAALATIAGPGYFDPLSIEDFSFEDAGPVGFANPSQLAYNEARALFPEHRLRHFISLGAGLPSLLELRNLSAFDHPSLHFEYLKKIANYTKRVHDSLAGELQKS
jgi:hypothetical protein